MIAFNHVRRRRDARSFADEKWCSKHASNRLWHRWGVHLPPEFWERLCKSIYRGEHRFVDGRRRAVNDRIVSVPVTLADGSVEDVLMAWALPTARYPHGRIITVLMGATRKDGRGR